MRREQGSIEVFIWRKTSDGVDDVVDYGRDDWKDTVGPLMKYILTEDDSIKMAENFAIENFRLAIGFVAVRCNS